MNSGFTWIDWVVVAVPICIVIWLGYRTQQSMRGVADFLSGGRLAGRYLVSVAMGEASIGLISAIGLFEQWNKSGFAIGFWGQITAPILMLLALTGFAIYRYRQTRAMTIGQFYQVRYSRGVRLSAGVVAWLSGVLNYAIFPAVGGRFIVYYFQLPMEVEILGFGISTYGLVMAVFLGFAVTVALAGGQMAIMVTDCVQGLFSYVCYAIVLFTIFRLFSFDVFREAMVSRPGGESFIDPFDTGGLDTFNTLFVLIGLIGSVYNRISWQGGAGYNSAAATPHEQKMGNLLGTWRAGYQGLMYMMVAIAAYAFLNSGDFVREAAAVHAELAARINFDNPATTETIRTQMLVPLAIRHFLPIGVVGIFAAVMLFHMIATDTTYLHSWGSMLVQDVVLPFKKSGFRPERQILLIRLSIAFVAVFAWIFSFTYSQTTYILMFFQLTGSLYMGFAGSLILGGLYWPRGTTAGAWAAMTVGVVWALVSFSLTQFWGSHIHPWMALNAAGSLEAFRSGLAEVGQAVPIVNWEWSETRFPVTGAELGFINILLCIVSYVGVSLLTCRERYNLDRMLHRGDYAREDTAGSAPAEVPSGVPFWKKLTGITEEYTRGDRILAWSVIVWTLFQFSVFLVVVVANLFLGRWGNEGFFLYWKYYQVGFSVIVGTVTTVWFTWGGWRDLIRFFRAIKPHRENVLDDGRVIGNVSADDLAQVAKVEGRPADAKDS